MVGADQPQELNCTNFNIIRPAEAINKTEGNHAVVIGIDQFTQNNEETQKLIMGADAIVVERNFFGDTLTTMEWCRVRNKTLIAIFDDGYQVMEKRNVAYPFWRHGEVTVSDENGKPKRSYMIPPPMTQFIWGLKKVKGIQVPSQTLADDWSKYNKTYHIPNYIVAHKYENVKPLYPHKDSIIIGWGGSMSHLESFTESGILKALKQVTHKYNNVKVMISGDKRVFDEVDLSVNKKIFQPYVPEEQFLSLMKTFDIALAPLITEFDRRRSHIKVLEYMALKMPWICSDFPTYQHLKKYGISTENTAEAWEEKLCYMIDNLEERRAYAEGEPFEFAMEQSYDKNIQKTLELYQSLIDEPYLPDQRSIDN
jgi:glycosyltransferase involved in cell wall biosynthesis